METGEEKDTVEQSAAQATNGTAQIQDGSRQTADTEKREEAAGDSAVDALFATSSSPVDAGDGNVSDGDAGQVDISLDSNGHMAQAAASDRSQDAEKEEEGRPQQLGDGGDRMATPPPEGEQHPHQGQTQQAEAGDRIREEDGEEPEEAPEETRDGDSAVAAAGDTEAQQRHDSSMEDDAELGSGDEKERRSPSPVAAASASSPRGEGLTENGEEAEEGRFSGDDDSDADRNDRTPASSPGGRVSNIASDQGVGLGSQNFDSDDGDFQSGEYSAREPNAAVQGVVQDVLEKVLATGTGTDENGEQVEDDFGDGVGAGQNPEPENRFPELEKVELSSEDEERDLREQEMQRRDAGFQERSSSPDSEGDQEKWAATDELMRDSEQPPSLDEALDNRQPAAEQFSPDHKTADSNETEQELHGDSRTLYQHAAEAGQAYHDMLENQVTDRDQPRELERERRPPYSVPQEQTSSTSPSHPRVVPIHQEADQHQPSQHAVRHAEVSGRSAEFDDRDSHDGSYLWMRRQVPGRTERDVIVFTSSVPKDSRSSREPTHTSREPTHDSPGRRRDEAQESYRREAARQRQQVDRNASERSGSNTDASRSGLAGLSMSGSEVSGSVPSPGAIPNFRTLQDQQVSWLAMYRLLEEEHRGELQAQYVEHQRMINDMQRHLDRELLRQHQSVQQKLDKHREALIASSPRQQSSRREAERSTDSRHPRQTDQRDASDDSDVEETHMKPPSRNHYGRADIDSWETGGRASSHVDSAASQRSPDGRSSARSPREEHRSRSEQGREKRLRGGVYSSPMPISRTKAPSRGSSQPGSLNSSVRESGQLDGNMSNNARSSYESGRHQEESMSRSRDLSFHEDDVLSPRTRSSLREKHAKHLADLRAYYEAEIQELRDQLTAAAGGPVLSSSSSMGRETATERILREENQSLRLKCQDLQDALDDANIRTREMEQKLQGLEIRAADYADRYEDSQHTVLKLKNRLEELHAFAKDREAMLEEVEARERRQAAAMEELYKTKKEQAENQRRDKAALKRLLDKYETLEKEYTTLKNTSAEVENKLYEMRNETMDLNKIISRLELENKRLSHDNDNMRHRLAISGSLPITRQDVEETTERTRDRSTDRLAHSTGSLTNRQQDRSLDRLSARSPRTEGRLTSRSTMSDDEEADAGKLSDSPLLKAERELRRLQESMGRSDFALKLQPKKYSSVDSLPAYNGYSDVTIIDGLKSSSRSGSTTAAGEAKKSKPKKNLSAFGRTNPPVANGDPRDSVSGKPGVQNKPAEQAQSSSLSSPTRFDVGVRQGVSRSPPSRGAGQVVRERESSRDRAGERTRDKSPVNMSSSAKGTGQSVDATLERIRTGGIVSRPQWEDMYTSLAKPRQADNKSSSLNMTQEELLRERIRSIEQLEHRYDELTMEKRKLESQLNKVPIHGRVDRKSRREKELLEEQLDKVDHELGSLRMTLKRYQVLKTTI